VEPGGRLAGLPAPARTRSSASAAGQKAGRAKEQLYREAKRLGVEGRSKMTKAQLERGGSARARA